MSSVIILETTDTVLTKPYSTDFMQLLMKWISTTCMILRPQQDILVIVCPVYWYKILRNRWSPVITPQTCTVYPMKHVPGHVVLCKAAESPVLTPWRYCSFALITDIFHGCFTGTGNRMIIRMPVKYRQMSDISGTLVGTKTFYH